MKTKSILVGARALEFCREVGTYTGLEEPDKKVTRLISAGGFWTGKHGEKAGCLDQPLCKLCNAETRTMDEAYRHMFWQCQKLWDYMREQMAWPSDLRPGGFARPPSLPTAIDLL